MGSDDGRILVVDDDALNRVLLSTSLQDAGYLVGLAEDGLQALDALRSQPFDVVLLDLIMPEMDGYQVLEHLKADSSLRHIPVVVISAVDDMESVVRCIAMGATDHLPKPFDPLLLHARINASLATKRLHDQEQAYLKQLHLEQEKSERLLLNILPAPIAHRLKEGEGIIADSFAEVTVLFADLVGFTLLAGGLPPRELVDSLNHIFSAFDGLVAEHGLEKIKTIGDSYMAVGGLPTPRPDHAEAAADIALAMLDEINRARADTGRPLHLRIGVATGPVVAGVIGTRKFSYDLWGDTVNIASRMESHGVADSIQVSPETYHRLREAYVLEERGEIEVKGKGKMKTYLLRGKRAATP